MGPLAAVPPSIDVVVATAARLVLLYGQAEAAVGTCDGFWSMRARHPVGTTARHPIEKPMRQCPRFGGQLHARGLVDLAKPERAERQLTIRMRLLLRCKSQELAPNCRLPRCSDSGSYWGINCRPVVRVAATRTDAASLRLHWHRGLAGG